jgi:hypothetical protein
LRDAFVAFVVMNIGKILEDCYTMKPDKVPKVSFLFS